MCTLHYYARSRQCTKHKHIGYWTSAEYNTLSLFIPFVPMQSAIPEHRLRTVSLDVMFIAKNCYYYHCRFAHVHSPVHIPAGSHDGVWKSASLCQVIVWQQFHVIKTVIVARLYWNTLCLFRTRAILIAYKCRILVSHKIKIKLCYGIYRRRCRILVRAPAIIASCWGMVYCN